MLLFAFKSIAQSDSITVVQRLKSDINFLAADSLQGRYPGTYGAEEAAKWIESRLKNAKIKPLSNNFRFYFDIENDSKKITTFNIVARINKNKPCKLILVAHYDHIGLGDKHSREVNLPIIHNGADDNASGVAMVLRLVEDLQKKAKKLPYSVVVVFTSGHELGLFGASNFVNTNSNIMKEKPIVLNFDMIGRAQRNGDKENLLFRVDNNHYWNTNEMPKSNQKIELVLTTLETPLDQTVFFENHLKSATFSTGMHSDYHKNSDDASKINYQAMYVTYNYLKEYLNNSIGVILQKNNSK